ncbi:hypothetical protein [Methylobacterium planeticum]|uniref:VCBS repeat-containing protein n=1 Tax=Methylobacterium planeticum TaxID=2615211 RepID=A0A6N6MKA3_9HYPH|nr:hypothetical protein [Methylobacterium planeticum]KAB1069514.1 hypothetical protein F6X51_25140 [Methylobacterium planeticum]
MSERRRPAWLLAWLLSGLLAAAPAAADPAVAILDLPFRVTAMRGPGSEVAVAVATSGLLPIARPKGGRTADPAARGSEEDEAPLVVVWGEEGGAALSLVDGAVRTTLLGAEAIEGLAAAETPRGALPNARRALSGPISAYLTGPTRAMGGDGASHAAGLTIRERQPVAVSAEPKPVPVATATVSAGPEAVFAPRRPRVAQLNGRAAFVAVTATGQGASELVVIGREAPNAAWAVLARTPPQPGGALKVAAIGDFSGTGPQVAAVRAPEGAGVLQLWTYARGVLTLSAEAPGYTDGIDNADLAATLDTDRDGQRELALPTGDRAALALVSLKGGISERARIPLPAPAASGVAALGAGAGTRLLVGLADGRVAVIQLGGRS